MSQLGGIRALGSETWTISRWTWFEFWAFRIHSPSIQSTVHDLALLLEFEKSECTSSESIKFFFVFEWKSSQKLRKCKKPELHHKLEPHIAIQISSSISQQN